MRHEDQKELWEQEHRTPTALKQMDSSDASNSVQKFWQFLVDGEFPHASGIEMGCGKGRNLIWLAERGVSMSGFDFSDVAITEAKRRAAKVEGASFQVADATVRWPFDKDYFDFGIDCFASTDIESPEGRAFAIAEMRRVLKPGGLLMTYVSSTDDEYHKQMIQKFPSGERNTFLQPTGKFEKVYDEEELAHLFTDWEIVRKERIAKTTDFFGKGYDCNHFWLVLKKPVS
ncbi:MAG TPA: class I SAM-dependent methyltransferase [Candidatus Paceibacterota bacterium]